MSHSSPPPPPLSSQSNLIFNNNNANALPEYSPSTISSSSTSIVIVTIVIASAIIISASLYLLLRFLSRRNNNNNPNSIIITTPKTHTNTNTSSSLLPLFTFNTLPCHISGADCAVCLSKFEPHDQLRLLPLCCHAFHADCIDTWLVSNHTCPLCRSTTVYPDALLRSDSFRVQIGSVSRRRSHDSVSGEAVRSYTIGSFEYVVDEEFEVPIGDARTHRRQVSDKDSIPVAPGDDLAAEVAGDRGSWLRDYVDRIASVSFRSSGRFFGGSSRRSNAVDDLEANNRFGEEISELFQWLSGV